MLNDTELGYSSVQAGMKSSHKILSVQLFMTLGCPDNLVFFITEAASIHCLCRLRA